MKIDPAELGLPARTVIKEIGRNHIAIVKDRKSRIIMKDGEQISGLAGKIRGKHKGMKISFATSAPVCSKTTAYLKEQGIEIIPL